MSNLSKLIALQKGKTAEPAPPPAAEQVVTPAAPAKTGLGLNLLNKLPKAAPAPAIAPAPATPVEFSLEDLAGMDETMTPEVRNTPVHQFFDEIEATAPDRVLDPTLTPQQIGFVEQLDGVYGILHDPELFAQSIRIIMMELQENKEYIKLVSDQDVHTMIRGMRNSMGLARIKKQEKSRKTGTGTRKAAGKKSSVGADALALLDSLGFESDD